MEWNHICRSVGLVLTGLVTGSVFTLVLGSAEGRDEREKEILSKNTFGDLRIVTMPAEQTGAKDLLMVLNGDAPIITFRRNDSNEVDRFAITNGKHGTLAMAYLTKVGHLTKPGICNFVVFGNAVHDGCRGPIFMMEASDKPGVWHNVCYTPAVAGVYDDKGKLISYRTVGEAYFDLDGDGQFDAKQIWDEKSVVISESIFVNGEWRELGRVDSNGHSIKRVGSFDPDNPPTAFTRDVESRKKTYFDFVWGKGWQERSQGDENPGTIPQTKNPPSKG